MNRVTNKVLIILIVGIILILIAPLILTRVGGVISFTDTGQIGDTIGGITAPIASLIGSVLVFFALKAQIDANKIIQVQIQEQKIQDSRRKRISYISGQIRFIMNEIDEFTIFEKKPARGKSTVDQYIEHKGTSAILQFVSENVIRTGDGRPGEDPLKENPQLKHFYYMIFTFSNLVKVVVSEDLDRSEQEYFLGQLSFLFEAKILPGFETKNAQYHQDEPECEKCGKNHSGVPSIIFHLLEEIKENLNRD